MRLLAATWDGAGNLEPVAAVIAALVERGHEVHVLAHDVQRPTLEAVGATFVPFETAPQWDQGVAGSMGEDPIATFTRFDPAASADLLALAKRFGPSVVLVDCMLPSALTAAKGAGYRTVACVHALYSFFCEYLGGLFRGPIDAADLALGLTYEAFDRGAETPPNLHFVGPVRRELEVSKWARRSPGRPLVVASLSTGRQGDGQQPLLQRICDALAMLGVEALVTTGRGIAPETLRAGSDTVVERLVPHDAVLPQADLLITHGGHGTVMAALRYGVPMLCLAPRADQPLNAARVADLGLGLSLDPASSVEAISEGARTILANADFKTRSRAFAYDAAKSPGIETGIELVEALAAR